MDELVLTREGERWVMRGWHEPPHPAKQAGFAWDPRSKLWWSRSDADALKLVDFADLETLALLARAAREQERALETSRAADAELSVPARPGMEYRPFQRAGIAYALQRLEAGARGVLFGDEMGLGKTIQALGVLNADASLRRALVICPASLKLNWLREARAWLVRTTLAEVWGSRGVERRWWIQGDEPADEACLIAIVNYDVLGKLSERLLHREAWDALICDEAHYCKNPKAARTRSVFGQAHRAEAWIQRRVEKLTDGGLRLEAALQQAQAEATAKSRGGWVFDPQPIQARALLLLTGTPICNRAAEFWPLARACAPQEFRSWRQYQQRYVWSDRRLEELQARARASFMVRRLKRDVLRELPPKLRQVIEMPANGSERLVQAELRAWQAHEEAVTALRARAELAKAAETDEEYAAAVRALRAGVSAAFTELSKLRHETALAKLPLVVEHAREALSDGRKLVLFAHHKDVIATLRAELAEHQPAVITGDTPPLERQAEVDRFQKDEACRLFLGNLKAAGVGLTLTAASHVVFAELDWVPGNLSQAEDRCHRIGQAESVLVQHLVLEGSLDAYMAEAVVSKQAVIERALDSQAEVAAELAPAAIPVVPGEARDEAASAGSSRAQIAKEAEELAPERVAAIHEALRLLSAACDGAATHDGAGFSKIDTRIGKSLAAASRLSARQAALGTRLVRKYRRQLPPELLRAALAAGGEQ